MRSVTVDIEASYSVLKPSHVKPFLAAVESKLTVDAPGAKFTWDFKSGAWDGKTSVLQEVETGIFRLPTGLLPTVAEALHTWQLNFNDFRSTLPLKLNPSKVKLRDYQYDAVNAAFGKTLDGVGWWPRGVLQVATGGGKTEAAVAMYEMNPLPTMFLVHRKDLAYQAKERFEKYGHSPGMVGDGVFDLKHITVATMQSLHSIGSNPEDERYDALLKATFNTTQIFVDEAHLAASTLDKGNMFCKVIDHFDNANCRWGLTATPFMRGAYDNLLLEGVTGGLLYKITNAELIALGYLTPPKIKMLPVEGKLPITRPKNRSNKEIGAWFRGIRDTGIRYNIIRNRLIAGEIDKGNLTLCLTTTIEQAKHIQGYLKSTDVVLLTGKASAKERKATVEDLRAGKIRAIIATTIFDEGIDVPELRKIIFASGGKSPVKLLQRLGRGVRIAKGKTEVEIIDFADNHHPKLRDHALERLKVYKSEGFEVT